MSCFYVVSTCPYHFRLTNSGEMWAGTLYHGSKPKNVKEFKSLGWAKKAAEKAANNNPHHNLIVISLSPEERMLPDGLVVELDRGVPVKHHWGKQVATVVKSNLMISLFG